MTPTTATAFRVRGIQADVVAALRLTDDAGRAPRVQVDTDGDSPLRCCLRASRPDERVMLVSYAPLRRWAAGEGVDPGAYDEVGPVFIHAEPCDGPTGDGYPDDFRGTRRMLRGYSAAGHIVGARLVEPADSPEDAIAEVFADERVAVIHARAVEFGCFTFEIRGTGQSCPSAGTRKPSSTAPTWRPSRTPTATATATSAG